MIDNYNQVSWCHTGTMKLISVELQAFLLGLQASSWTLNLYIRNYIWIISEFIYDLLKPGSYMGYILY